MQDTPILIGGIGRQGCTLRCTRVLRELGRGVNLVIFSESEVDARGTLLLRDRRHRHLREVCRVVVGKTLRVGQLRGGVGVGTVIETDAAQTVLKVELNQPRTPTPAVDLVLALPRPQMLKRILENCAAFGVRRLCLIRSLRVERSYFSSPVLSEEVMRAHLLIGLEQGMTTWMPDVQVFPQFGMFFDKGLRDCYAGGRLLADTSGAYFLSDHQVSRAEPGVTIAIGPEGGWVRSELERFESESFHSFRMSERVLRVETAVYAALSQLEMIRAVRRPVE